MKAVVGATGQLGSLIAMRLLERGEKVRVMVRNVPAQELWQSRGAEAVFGDLKDPASLERFCRSADAVITTANAVLRGGADTLDAVDQRGNRNLIDAAGAAGVGRFVFVSALGADPTSPVPLMQAKGETEEYLKRSGIDYTILEPHLFMEVWIDRIVGTPLRTSQPVALIGDGRRLHSFVSNADVAAFAVAAASGAASRNRTLILGGPDAVSWREIVSRCGTLTGRNIPVRSLAPGSALAGFPPPLGEYLGSMLAALEMEDVVLDTAALWQEFSVPPKSLQVFLKEMVSRIEAPAAL